MNAAKTRHALAYAWLHTGVRVAAFAAALALLACLAAVWQWWRAADLHEQREQALDAARAAASAQSADGETTEAYLEAERALALVDARLDAPAQQSALVQALARLASEHGVILLSQGFDNARAAEGLRRWSSELALQGRYAQLRGFIGALQSLPLWVEITELRIDAARTDGSAGMLRAALRLSIASRVAAPVGQEPRP